MSLIFIFSAVKLGYKSNRYQDCWPIVMDLRAEGHPHGEICVWLLTLALLTSDLCHP